VAHGARRRCSGCHPGDTSTAPSPVRVSTLGGSQRVHTRSTYSSGGSTSCRSTSSGSQGGGPMPEQRACARSNKPQIKQPQGGQRRVRLRSTRARMHARLWGRRTSMRRVLTAQQRRGGARPRFRVICTCAHKQTHVCRSRHTERKRTGWRAHRPTSGAAALPLSRLPGLPAARTRAPCYTRCTPRTV